MIQFILKDIINELSLCPANAKNTVVVSNTGIALKQLIEGDIHCVRVKKNCSIINLFDFK